MRKLYIFGLIALAVVIIGLAWAEQLTFTTYYSAPAGVYRQFATTSQTCLATNPSGADAGALVGIGTTNPAGILHVDGGTAATGSGRNIILQAENAETFLAANGGNILLLPGSGNSGGADGRVGIGTTQPGATLEVNESIAYTPRAGDPATEWPAGTEGELVYSNDNDEFYYYNGQAWVAQIGVGGGASRVLYLVCGWGSDSRAGADSGWGNQCGASGLSCCTPPACPAGWTSVATFPEPISVYSQGNNANVWWDGSNSSHPLVTGRTVRVCVED